MVSQGLQSQGPLEQTPPSVLAALAHGFEQRTVESSKPTHKIRVDFKVGFFVCFVFVSYIPKFQSCIPCRKVITRVMYLETYVVSYLPSSNIICSTEDVHTANTCNNLKCISCFHVSIMFCPAGVGVNLNSHMCSVPYIIH